MKILFINTLYYPNIVGGAERSVQFLAETLVQQGHNAVVITTSPDKGNKIVDVNGVKVYYVNLKNVYWPFQEKKAEILKPIWHAIDTNNISMGNQVDAIIDIEKPDLVHTNNLAGFSTVVWALIKKRNIPIVHTLRDYYLLCPRSKMFKNGNNCNVQCLECKPYAILRKKRSKLVDAVIGNSDFILKKHIEHGYFNHTAYKNVIYNAYKTRNKKRKSEFYTKKFKIGYIGRLSSEKGVDLLVKTFNNLHCNEDVELIIAGKGETGYEGYLHSLVSNNNIKFIGFAQPETFFEHINFSIVPSLWHEPLPRVIFESYAHGVPVIGSNRGGIPELIDEGETGFIFNPDDEASLLYYLQMIIKNPYIIHQMSGNCLEKAKLFLPDKIIKQYVFVYKTILSQYKI